MIHRRPESSLQDFLFPLCYMEPATAGQAVIHVCVSAAVQEIPSLDDVSDIASGLLDSQRGIEGMSWE